MFEVSERSAGNVIGVKTSGKLLHADYQQFIPKFEQLIEQHGSIRCVVELVDFGGFELRALWDELKFDTKHGKDIERCAVVGDRNFEKWATNLFKPFFYRAELKYFDSSEVEDAWEWIEEGTGATCCAGTQLDANA